MPIRAVKSVGSKRFVRRPQGTEFETPEQRAQRIKVQHADWIARHPQYEYILAALKEGINCTRIASYYAEQGWLQNVNEQTFLTYLYHFREVYPDRLKVVSKSVESDEYDIDLQVPGQAPDIDPELELSRLYRAQKRRIGRSMQLEKNMGLPLVSLSKDMEVANKILENMVSAKGVGTPVRSGGGAAVGVTSDAREHLRKLRETEGGMARLTGLTEQLFEGLANGVKGSGPGETEEVEA